jgi:methylmalonyl-CoA mutase
MKPTTAMRKKGNLFMAEPLSLEEFSEASPEEWRAAAEASLGGQSFAKALQTRTYEGLTLDPLYSQADIADLPHLDNLPGWSPYVRGDADPSWQIAQQLSYRAPQAFNAALRHDLDSGLEVINLQLASEIRSGFSHTTGSSSDGIAIFSLSDIAEALEGIDLTHRPVLVDTGSMAYPFTALLVAYAQQTGYPLDDLDGCLDFDPLGALAEYGSLPYSLDAAYAQMAQLSTWTSAHAPQLDAIAIQVDVYHNSGANAVQELAYALATGVAYVRQMLDRGLPLDSVTSHMRFTFAVGSNFFMEVAKLRAARLLWSQVVTAFGGTADNQN